MAKCVVYVASDGETYHFETPTAENRMQAVTLFMQACEKAGDDPRLYRIVRCDGFAPSRTEREIWEHAERFGGG